MGVRLNGWGNNICAAGGYLFRDWESGRNEQLEYCT